MLQGSSASRRRRCGGRVGTSGAGFQLRQNVARRLTEPSLQSRALRSTCLKTCFLHSQVPLRLPSGLQPTARHPRQLPFNSSGSWRQRACFDTPLPLWCTRLCPGPSRLHKRELKVQSHSRGHWNPHSNLEFDFGGAARMRAVMRAGGRL